MKKYSKADQKALATWAADCAERVLPFFEKTYPHDERPREAIKTCRTWIDTGIFKIWNWQVQHVAKHLRDEVIKRVIIEKSKRGIVIKIHKDEDF